MSILLSEKSKNYIEKNKISEIFIDINFIEEPCTQVYEPKITIINSKNKKELATKDIVSDDGLTLSISDSFIKIYGLLDEYQLELGGLLKKMLRLNNVEPIIKNICKIN
ncbi:MAG: hypothetical protein KGD74_06945 [Candidatus Lokiarchaeota archaeon]|nr:hypothetical protein [Candidatus Lokiarchaeota archaeon]